MSAVLPFRSGAQASGTHLPAKVLVLHRDADAAATVGEVVQSTPSNIVQVLSFRELLDQADDRTYGVVLLDYASFRSEALAHVAAFLKERPAYPIVVWSSQLELPLGVEAMKWGASDVLRKPADNAALGAVLQNTLASAREALARWQEYRKVVKHFGQLTPSEKAVLSLVMQGRTNKEIAAKLDCSLRTVEARRQRILRVMETENAIELAVVLARHSLMDVAIQPVAAPQAVPAPAAPIAPAVGYPWGGSVSHVS
jgi:two-component system, LuxR family, response regulator FixJ